jgi:maltose alpha-D-glucosyltransferase/alpha-amylase
MPLTQPTQLHSSKGTCWWKDAVFYEVYAEKFGGNFSVFSKRLDYFKLLGINCLHLLPHYPSPMIDDGYDVSDYMNVRKELGSLEDFERFVAAAHEKGIRIMVDLVLNHVSTKHPWFIEARSSAINQKRDFFLWSPAGRGLEGSANPFSDIKATNWIYNSATNDYYYSTFYPEQADLNWDNPEVFTEITKIIDFWADKGVDGFRLDASAHLVKRENTNSKGLPETHAMLKGIRAHLDAKYGNIALLAEVHDPISEVMKYFGEGDECHLVYHFPLVEQLFLSLIRNDMAGMRSMIESSRGIPASCSWAVFLRHHDEFSLATLKEDERRQILDTFDPDGKYRFGTGASIRLATMFKGNEERILDAFRLLLSVPGSPILYYGDEIAMENGPLAPSEKDTRKCLRENFDWDKAVMELRTPTSLFRSLARLIRQRELSRRALRGIMDEIPPAQPSETHKLAG